MTDWSKVLIRCSSLGAILTEPKSKADKEAGNLSETAKGELVKIYNLIKYGRKKEVYSKFLEKGNQAEHLSIELLSRVDNRKYEKNEYQLSNEFISGTPDIIYSEDGYVTKEVIDTKTCWDLDSYQSNRHKKPDEDNELQVRGYMALTGAKIGQVCYCLVDTPESILNGERYKLLNRMDAATEEDPEYKIAVAELEYSHLFSDIPDIEKVIRIKYSHNEEIMQAIYKKVELCRIWLANFDKSPRVIN